MPSAPADRDSAASTRARNKAALILFGRTVVMTYAVIGGGLGFFAGIAIQQPNYDPYAFASGVGALFAVACAVIALLLMRRRANAAKRRMLETRIEELEDRNWELREAEERARSLLEAQGDVILRRDAQGRVTYANDAFCTLAGKPRAALIGKTLGLNVLEQGAATVLADGTRVHDQKIAGASGARWIAWREVDVRGEAGREVQSVGRDVTDRVEAEQALGLARDQAESANRAKSRFLATVSHEIRTPLNGMLGMADLLLDTPLTPEQTTYAKAAKTSGETLLSLIEEILDFSKIEAGKLELDAQPFALLPLVEQVVELLALRAQAKGIEIACFVDDCVPAHVVGDAARLRQVLLNLAGNAIKFTEQGGVSIVVEPAPHAVRFMVCDTGVGLKADDQARIFLEFEQADGSSTRKFGGTGLGLAITKRIVELMDGSIRVQSAPGAGAAFTVTLPLPAAADAPKPDFVAPDLTGQSIVIVAAARIEAALLARHLGAWGARAKVVHDAVSAAALLSEKRCDALLVDYPLAGEGTLASIAVPSRIVLIKPTDRHELPALKDAGFTGYLVKPVRAATLAARLGGSGAFEHPAEEIVEETSTAAASEIAGLSILIAEDNDINALLARTLLTRMGHRPIIATDGAMALQTWRDARAAGTPYDLVLMDIQMPGMDGLEATRHIRALEAEEPAGQRPTRILALTANAQAEDREAALAAGMDGWLVKPLDREKLREALEHAGRAGATLAA